MIVAFLFVWLINGGLMQIEFLGEIHEFPDNFTDDQISGALQGYSDSQSAANTAPAEDTSSGLRTERTKVNARTEYTSTEGEQEDFEFPELTAQNDTQRSFAENIATLETGGLKERFIRTKVTPSQGGSGSSAYGPYQITHGLLSGTLEQSIGEFTVPEQRAAQELLERQEVSLAIGGRDREKYEKGGMKYGLALRWAKQYGYEDVNKFLDAFDYGGDFGLADDGDFQTLYESFARKMLNKNLKEAGGDELEAASRWHGGPNWNKGKHKAKTQNYRDKYQKLLAP